MKLIPTEHALSFQSSCPCNSCITREENPAHPSQQLEDVGLHPPRAALEKADEVSPGEKPACLGCNPQGSKNSGVLKKIHKGASSPFCYALWGDFSC